MSRNRPSEYDTSRDPLGPISAGAQVLVGAIANFVTGIGEVPYDIITDIVSAGRAMSQPPENKSYHSRSSTQRKRRKTQDSSSNSDEERYYDSAEYRQSERPNHDDDAMSVDETPHEIAGPFSATAIDRSHSFNLDECQLMSYVDPPKDKSAIHVLRTHGSRMSKKLLKTIFWLPTDLTLSLSKGFHNAPKMYHDRMVKETPKVVGFRSGLTAAGTVRHESITAEI